MYNILNRQELNFLKKKQPKRFECFSSKGFYLNLKGLKLKPMKGIDVGRMENLARIVRGLSFAIINCAKSGHPGGSSSKVEQVLTLLLSGVLAFDSMFIKHPSRDRVVWSAGHCTPLFYSVLALIYHVLRKRLSNAIQKELKAALPLRCFHRSDSPTCAVSKAGLVLPECLTGFKRYNGLPGHIEGNYALADVSTGSSGHGFSAALGLATLHKSCGLDTKIFVIAGDAETEEGISYEARNLSNALGMDNIVVVLDHNGFGIDGPISDVVSESCINYWISFGWNVIEVDGHSPVELAYAYQKAVQGFDNKRATVIIADSVKGKHYGKYEGRAESHSVSACRDEYFEIMKKLGFNIAGTEGEIIKDVDVVISHLTKKDEDYLLERLEVCKKNIKSENESVAKIKKTLKGRPLIDYRNIRRPKVLPPELIYKEGENIATQKAAEAFFKYLMKQTAFFYIGAADVGRSALTSSAESIYGLITENNPLGRGIRFGISEQNMAMMSATLTQDILPGGFQAMSIFASYAVFTPIMANSVRMALINNAVNPKSKGFFIMIAAHDGLEMSKEGPTHHGLFWAPLFNAYPGIKIYKPFDANETIEMFFHALASGEPVIFSVTRLDIPVFKRGKGMCYGQEVPPAREAVNGAYVFKPFRKNGKKKVILAVCGSRLMANVLEIVPELEKSGLDIKILAVTSPELYEELKRKNPRKANLILSDNERQYVIVLHDDWPGFLHPFVLEDDCSRRILGIKEFQKSGSLSEIYQAVKFDPRNLKIRILKAL